MACEKHCRSPRYLSGLLAKIHTSRYRSNVHIGRSETYRHQVVDVAKYWVEIGRSNHAAYLVTGTVEVLAPTNYQVLVLVLKIMDAGYCLYVHIFMKNIKSLKPFNFYNSNQLMPSN